MGFGAGLCYVAPNMQLGCNGSFGRRCRWSGWLAAALWSVLSTTAVQAAPEDGGVPEGAADQETARGQATSDAGVAQAPEAGGSDSGAAAGSPAEDGGAKPKLVPPRVLESVPPVYPSEHLSHGEHPTVVLKVTVLADGTIADIHIEHSAGEDFDAAAIEAVRAWRFEPARLGEQPIASRVGVAVHFDLPELAVMDVAAVTSAEVMVPHPHDEPAPDHVPKEPPAVPAYRATAQVSPELRQQRRGSSDYHLDAELLQRMPQTEVGDLLKAAPGMVATRIEGDAVGHRLMLRGFDADHGQDIALSVDGVPVNQLSHLHGQGYADLGFIIPELVRELRVIEGVYDPAQGDFAVAGSADFRLGVEQRGVRLLSSYGAFDTFRELALWAPEGQPRATFAAVQFRKSRGFGQNRASTSGAAAAQGVLGSGSLRLTLHGSAYASRASTANVVRRDDIEAGRIGFYDVYPYPTTEAQGGFAARAQVSAQLRQLGEDGQNSELLVYFVLQDFRLLANYTGFTEISQINPAWTGRGDLIEQQNLSRSLGARGRYRTARYAPWPWASGSLELGLTTRVDQIAQSQNLLEAPDNTTWDQRVDAEIVAIDIGGYLDLDLDLTRYVSVRGGVRADLLSYGVSDRLQNFLPSSRPEQYIPGYRRSAIGIAAGPRVALDVKPIEALTLSAAYGEGYRSPQARLLDDGEPAPFSKVRSYDLGARLGLGSKPQWVVRMTGFLTQLGDDIAFDAREGRAEPVGPTTRLGAVLATDARPWPWLRLVASATYVRATLDEPPPPTPEAPNPVFSEGQRLPYVPPWVLRLDAQAQHPLWRFPREPLQGHVSLGFTHWSDRPLPYGETTPDVSLLDLSLGLGYRALRLSTMVLNLLDARYAALELVAPSNFDPGAIPSRVPARHVIAGAPRTWLLTVEVAL